MREGGASVELGCEATRVEVLAAAPPAARAEVAVTARDGRVFRADQCVLAAPVKALGAVEFSPPLSPAKQRALAEVPMGSIAKVSLLVESERWLEGKRRGGVAVPGLPPSANAYNCAGGRVSGDANCVVTVYAVGQAAEHIASLPRERRVAAAAEAVSRSPAARGSDEPALREPERVTQGADKVWREDTSSRGAYAFFRPGQIAVRWEGAPLLLSLTTATCGMRE